MGSFKEALKIDGRLIYKTRGYSMLPMLHQNQDLVLIEVPEGRLKKYDVAFYQRGNDYVLHRVIKVCKQEYLTRGDNTYSIEHVKDDKVLGILTGFVRNGKEHSVEEIGYKIYSHLWCMAYPLRVFYMRMRRTTRSAVRKMGLKKQH